MSKEITCKRTNGYHGFRPADNSDMVLCVQGVLGGVQGAESLFLWRAIGGAVLTLVPAIAYSLKVCPLAALLNPAM